MNRIPNAIVVALLALSAAACGNSNAADSGTNNGDSATNGNDVTNHNDAAGNDAPVGDGGGDNCAAATTCGACTALGTCGFCGTAGGCHAGTGDGPTDNACTSATWSWLASQCPDHDAGPPCSSAHDCAACTGLSHCGWCANSNTCLDGQSTGPTDMSCTTAQWSWTGEMCGGSSDGGATDSGTATDSGSDAAVVDAGK